MEKVKRNRYITIFILFFLFIGTIAGFVILENLNFFDALWLTFTSLLTIGYGDIFPRTLGGKFFALLMVPLGIISFTYLAGSFLSALIDYNLSLSSRSKRMIKRIKRYKKHIIICGAQGMAGQMVEQLRQKDVTFVLVDHDEKRLEPFAADCTIVLGDPSEEDVLLNAGIERAEAVLAVKSDAENLMIILTARELNKEVNIISSADKQESEKKLKRAGANFVINPERIGGNRMILSALKPAAVDYIDKIFSAGGNEFHVEKMLLNEQSTLVGMNLKKARLRELYQVSVMGIHRDNQILTTDLAEMELKPHDALILFGKVENLETMEESVQADTLV